MERRLAVSGGRRRMRPAAAVAARSGGRAARRSGGGGGVALRRKVRELRRLVPGGEGAPARSLLVRTADYIVRLKARVELLRALSALYDDLPHYPAGAGAGAGV
uniref:BHLH domain-containing protein n=1 Tax=Oryza punctata TaxID=4537 RepID=A0A0E0LUY2_ORYPU